VRDHPHHLRRLVGLIRHLLPRVVRPINLAPKLEYIKVNHLVQREPNIAANRFLNVVSRPFADYNSYSFERDPALVVPSF